MSDPTVAVGSPPEARCAECNALLAEDQDRETTEGGVFCRRCYDNLSLQLRQVIREQGSNVNYPVAALGGLAGGAVGVAVWWGFTVLTKIAFGLVAVVIGFTVGHGVVLLSGRKRSPGLQALSVAIAACAFIFATYLVDRTFIQNARAAVGQPVTLPLLPEPGLFFAVVHAGFGVMDLVFLAIVVWQAWKIPQPLQLKG